MVACKECFGRRWGGLLVGERGERCACFVLIFGGGIEDRLRFGDKRIILEACRSRVTILGFEYELEQVLG